MSKFSTIYTPFEIEKEVFSFWKTNKIYEKVKKRGDKPFFFVDGPPYTTGRIHLGTAWNKIIKDTVLRYKRMSGFKVTDTPGWDMHGLPIEVKVEQEIGVKTKREIEKYGIDKFVKKCMEYALRNRDLMTEQFKMLGVWMDWDNPYMTITANYINSAWWTIKKAEERSLLERKMMVVNWCPRCETALADAEVEYKEVKDPSIYVKFKIVGEKDTYIVIWTTTPWTLPANIAVAVNPDLEYALVEVRKNKKIEKIIIAKNSVEDVVKKGNYDSWKIIEVKLGKELAGMEYEHPLVNEIPLHKSWKHRVYSAEFVTAENTGCVHIAPAHGQEDYELGIKEGLEIFNPVDDRGFYTKDGGKYAGIYVKDANQIIIEDLKRKGLLLYEGTVIHRYGHCWRCKTPIIYRATKQWFLRISTLKNRMVEEIDKVKWIPEWAGASRFKDWVSNAKDWCISRQRYWGIPLPIWICEKCGKRRIIGSIYLIPWSNVLDLHRPKIDEITFDCECGGKMRRVSDVFDVWFDSGVASWAVFGYPKNEEKFLKLWPADFITEGHDQTRGWFYSQLGASLIAFDCTPYKTVLMHGFTLDEHGRKMSKSLGNVVEPEEVIEKVGVDSFRLYMLSSALWEDLRFSWDEVKNINRILNIFWNSIRFAFIYMDLDKFKEVPVKKVKLNTEDKWILSRIETINKLALEAYENYQLHKIVRLFSDFVVEDLSRWYIQLIRPRVWEEFDSSSKLAAYATILSVVEKLIKIMAPCMPFVTEWLYQNFVKRFKKGKESVFLEDFPKPDETLIDQKLEKEMEVAREIFEAVGFARQKAKRKFRWPLRTLIVETQDEEVKLAVKNLESIIKSQCNVKSIKVAKKFNKKLKVKPNYKNIGPILKEKVKDFEAFLKSLNEEELANLVSKNSFKFNNIELKTSDALTINYELPENYEWAKFSGGTIYIYTAIDNELKKECYARELVRRIQEMRKELDLKVDEFIDVDIELNREMIKGWEEYIKHETRAKRLSFKAPEGYIKEWEFDGMKVKIGIKRMED
ncbi:isoleucine--tRNA ligase [Candidatus Bathyarchaeota archaeon]|nr:MAG: isoleucine--tRNA ligase [Candidatus Bathyarchaeota archaeon]